MPCAGTAGPAARAGTITTGTTPSRIAERIFLTFIIRSFTCPVF
jgi:hypothetical protein